MVLNLSRLRLAGLAASFMALLTPVQAGWAQTVSDIITNTADATWENGTVSNSARSNPVSVTVTEARVNIETFRPVSIGGASINFRSSRCAGRELSLANSGATANGGQVALNTAETNTFRVGEHLIFRIRSSRANVDPSAIDSVTVILRSQSGDSEELTVFETGPNTGLFIGEISTIRIPPAIVSGDCRLSVANGDNIEISATRSGNPNPIAVTVVSVLADPFGFVFDSEDGRVVDGAIVTLIDAATGQPATVFAFDGVTPWPSTVISGQPITDGAGNVFPMQPGEYRFPLAALGNYRLAVQPPAPYTAPSVASRERLAELQRPTGEAYVIVDASFGDPFPLASTAPVRVDIPLDPPSITATITKTASRAQVVPGDIVFYTLTLRNADPLRAKQGVTIVDTPSPWLRLRRNSVRVDGREPEDGEVTFSPNGNGLTVDLGAIESGASRNVTYAMVVRADAPAGNAVNDAIATDNRGREARANAVVRVSRETIGSRMTLIGRVSAGSCSITEDRIGIPGVRLMLEDGSFTVTDEDGRYHFEGIMPGTHVVQANRQTLPEGGEYVNCARSTRNAGSDNSRFVIGQGGSLIVADFHATVPQEMLAALRERAEQAEAEIAVLSLNVAESSVSVSLSSDTELQSAENLDARTASGAQTDWLALGDGPNDWLFPAIDHNPRSPAVRVVIRHRANESVKLLVNGKPVDPLAFDGARKSSDGTYAVSIWRGVALDSAETKLTATITTSDGAVSTQIYRTVQFTSTPARAKLISEQTRLIADGATNPVVAVRITDRAGRPIRSGVSGSVSVNAPYESAQARNAEQLRQLDGLGQASPTWTIADDDGIALIELSPTLVSGPVHLGFSFTDGEITRTQEIDSWMIPGDQEWTIVGLAEGTNGARSIADNMERSGDFDSDFGDDARVAFYAKGQILGKFLLTVAYDSAKQEDEERLLGFIDPNAYYSVFADRSQRQFDAASREKLYVRIETGTFYALYGDFVTGFDQTQLGRYNRTATGVKAEGRFGAFHAQGFASETASRNRRDEIQGNGLTGPYSLSSRAIIPNSERVVLEIRDRFRSELLISREVLTRFIDYDIDLLSGTISFKQPILSRDFALNPQFIVIDYEIDTLAGQGEWNAGVRADYTALDGALRVGASVITDKGEDARTNVAAVDVRARVGADTEIRVEVGASRNEGATSFGWLIEAEHHTGTIDVLAYARSLDEEYGVAQQNLAERGRRKIGFDARYSPTEQLSITGSLWRDDSLTNASRRSAAQIQSTYRTGDTDLRIGVARFSDRLADGTRGQSTVLEGGISQRLLGNRLELNASSSIALEGTESIDLPTRHTLGASYAITSSVRAIASYEIAEGDSIDARTVRAGLEIAPWQGARIVTNFGQQDIAELGERSFAAFGLAQSLPVTSSLTLDATLDGSRTIGGVDAGRVINPDQPVVSGGFIGQDGSLFEDFTAATLGATWRKDRWSATGRAEYRDGEFADRKGLTFGAIRQLGEGSVVGSGFAYTEADGTNGIATSIFDAAIAAAHRPDSSEFALLGKVEYRADSVANAVLGETGPAGRTALTVNGNAKSRRLIGSLSTNWSPRGIEDRNDDGIEELFQRSEIGVFIGARYNFDRFDGFDLAGFTALGGVDAHIGIDERFEIGGSATVRSNLTDNVTSFSVGPQVGFVPADNMLLTVGYNITGFRDYDFSAARNTDKGLYAAIRVKFDADTFAFLGLQK